MYYGMKRLDEIQAALLSEGLDGWLLYDFRGLNPIALRVAGISPGHMLTGRWACYVPAVGSPRWLVHAIETGGFGDLALSSRMRWSCSSTGRYGRLWSRSLSSGAVWGILCCATHAPGAREVVE